MKELIGPEIQQLIHDKNWRVLKKTLSGNPAPDIADLWETLDEQDMFIIFRLLSKQLAADVFNELDPDRQISLLGQMRSAHVRDIISELLPDERTDLFEELPGKMTQKLLNLLPPEIRKESLELLGYPKDSVGRLMTPHYVAICPQWTIERALEHIRLYGCDAETIDMVYVVDEKCHLIDEIPLRRLILADPQQTIECLMDRRFVSVSTLDDQEKAVEVIQRYNLVALPVIDSENVLVGIVTVDDILDVLQEEVTDDIQKMAGIVADKDLLIDASVFKVVKARMPWLLICLAGGLVAGGVIAVFENALASVLALAFYVPVVMGMGGNAGTQTSTVIVRGIATKQIDPKRIWRTLFKELKIGAAIGLISGIAVGAAAFLWQDLIELSMTVGFAMFFTVMVAATAGGLLPFIFKLLRIDPALTTGPFVTTIKDVTGLLIYFASAMLFMRHLM
ncbi:MAG: magnesium transporter [Dehalococcoidia bacterium]|nr:Magnesium transporter MgtE [Chloroflexota bacterium]MBT9161913.1 Magnesium transporter MgtE [Chloroflexota bacterium]